jgi:hypothetical protein
MELQRIRSQLYQLGVLVKTNIILISGKQGSGKTTLAKSLCKRFGTPGLPKWQAINMTFAEPLYEMHNYCRKVLTNAGVDPIHKIKDGNLLQLLGTEWGRKTLGENIWVDICKGRIKKEIEMNKDRDPAFKPSRLVFIVSDCRFENELFAFDDALTVRLECDDHIRKSRAEMWRENTQHPSEIGLDDVDYDVFDLVVDTGKNSVDHAVELIISSLLRDHT